MKVALFPGRFQPPHLGHVLSIMSIYDDYDYIIIGITGVEPTIMTQEQVAVTFSKIFKNSLKIRFINLAGKKKLEWINYIPKDVNIVITANKETAEELAVRGIKHKLIKRGHVHDCKGNIIDYSGSDIRKCQQI